MFQDGSLRLFRVAGISVFLHWTWALVAVFQIQARANTYQSPAWMVAEYLTLFGIVLLHEFGHALACRQVGGVAEKIVLWPLGGIAYVNPPPRPGALLWSIAAGPLVNLILLPLTVGLYLASHALHLPEQWPDLHRFLGMVAFINGVLLFFNVLPIYPLDGGQIVQALLWFVLGRARSLMVASAIGLPGGVALLGVTYLLTGRLDPWLVVITVFLVFRAIAGFMQGLALSRLLRMPRHGDFACPLCGAAPIKGRYMTCEVCHHAFDPFESTAVCPNCSERYDEAPCLECGRIHPYTQWVPAVVPLRPPGAARPFTPSAPEAPPAP
jgi:Zn-dependent protease